MNPSPEPSDLAAKIEAVLFWKAEPVPLRKLAELIGEKPENVTCALDELARRLETAGSGLSVVMTDDEAMLGTASRFSPTIEQLTKDELARDLGKAGLETLSIILYQGPIARADIDYIRGVNSQFILRNLLIRGLIDRVENPADARSFLYKPTVALLSHLGVSNITDLPDFEQVRRDIESFRTAAQAAPSGDSSTSATIGE